MHVILIPRANALLFSSMEREGFGQISHTTELEGWDDVPDNKEHVRALIRRFAKNKISDDVLAQYDIQGRSNLNGFSDGSRGIYYEAPNALQLTYDGEGIAAIVFQLDREDGFVFIKQIQGVYGKQESLMPLKWERLLLAATIDFAQRVPGCTEIEMMGAKYLTWYANPQFTSSPARSIDDYQRNLSMRYDGTAKRSGFRWSEERRCWVYLVSHGDDR